MHALRCTFEGIQHRGCVNSLSWSSDGEYLVSGSDDRSLVVWQWSSHDALRLEKASVIPTAHRANIFGAKFMRHVGFAKVLVSGAMDGRVYVHRSTESSRRGRRAWPIPQAGAGAFGGGAQSESASGWASQLLLHCNSRVKDIDVDPSNPHIVFTAAEDGNVCCVDIRTPGGMPSGAGEGRLAYLAETPPAYSVEKSTIISLRFLTGDSFQPHFAGLPSLTPLVNHLRRGKAHGCGGSCVDCRIAASQARQRDVLMDVSSVGALRDEAQAASISGAELRKLTIGAAPLKHACINAAAPQYIAVAATDPFLRVYDRRMLPPLATRSGGGGLHLSACASHRNVLRFAPLHATGDVAADTGRSSLPRMSHVTRVDWDVDHARLASISSSGMLAGGRTGAGAAAGVGTGRHLLGHYHADAIYIFDTRLADLSGPVDEIPLRPDAAADAAGAATAEAAAGDAGGLALRRRRPSPPSPGQTSTSSADAAAESSHQVVAPLVASAAAGSVAAEAAAGPGAGPGARGGSRGRGQQRGRGRGRGRGKPHQRASDAHPSDHANASVAAIASPPAFDISVATSQTETASRSRRNAPGKLRRPQRERCSSLFEAGHLNANHTHPVFMRAPSKKVAALRGSPARVAGFGAAVQAAVPGAARADSTPAPPGAGAVKPAAVTRTAQADGSSAAASGSPSHQLCSIGDRWKMEGNDAFRGARFHVAATCFSRGISHALDCMRSPPVSPDSSDALASSDGGDVGGAPSRSRCVTEGAALLMTNRAIALLKRNSDGDADTAVEDCIRALELCPTWWKAHLRLAKALKEAHKPSAALATTEAFLREHAPEQLALATQGSRAPSSNGSGRSTARASDTGAAVSAPKAGSASNPSSGPVAPSTDGGAIAAAAPGSGAVVASAHSAPAGSNDANSDASSAGTGSARRVRIAPTPVSISTSASATATAMKSAATALPADKAFAIQDALSFRASLIDAAEEAAQRRSVARERTAARERAAAAAREEAIADRARRLRAQAGGAESSESSSSSCTGSSSSSSESSASVTGTSEAAPASGLTSSGSAESSAESSTDSSAGSSESSSGSSSAGTSESDAVDLVAGHIDDEDGHEARLGGGSESSSDTNSDDNWLDFEDTGADFGDEEDDYDDDGDDIDDDEDDDEVASFPAHSDAGSGLDFRATGSSDSDESGNWQASAAPADLRQPSAVPLSDLLSFLTTQPVVCTGQQDVPAASARAGTTGTTSRCAQKREWPLLLPRRVPDYAGAGAPPPPLEGDSTGFGAGTSTASGASGASSASRASSSVQARFEAFGADHDALYDCSPAASRLTTRLAGACAAVPNMQTDIKEACFWHPAAPLPLSVPPLAARRAAERGGPAAAGSLGRLGYIAAASDTGDMVLFDRASGAMVGISFADDDILNVVQPHPTLPVLATSGIECTVKLWAPLSIAHDELSDDDGATASVAAAASVAGSRARGRAAGAAGAADSSDSKSPDAAAEASHAEARRARELPREIRPTARSGAGRRYLTRTHQDDLADAYSKRLLPAASNDGMGFGLPRQMMQAIMASVIGGGAAGGGPGAGAGGGGDDDDDDDEGGGHAHGPGGPGQIQCAQQ